MGSEKKGTEVDHRGSDSEIYRLVPLDSLSRRKLRISSRELFLRLLSLFISRVPPRGLSTTIEGEYTLNIQIPPPTRSHLQGPRGEPLECRPNILLTYLARVCSPRSRRLRNVDRLFR